MRVQQIRGLTKAQREGLSHFLHDLHQDLQGRLHAVILFGSRARGQRSNGSDVDLLVLVRGRGREPEETVYRALVDEELQWNARLSPKVYDWKTYQRKKSLGVPFIKELDREEIRLVA